MKQLTAYRKPKDPGYVGGFYWPPTIFGFIGLFLTNVIATQFVAWRFHLQPALGPALVRIGSFSLYAPYKWLVWVWQILHPGTMPGTSWYEVYFPSWPKILSIFFFSAVLASLAKKKRMLHP